MQCETRLGVPLVRGLKGAKYCFRILSAPVCHWLWAGSGWRVGIISEPVLLWSLEKAPAESCCWLRSGHSRHKEVLRGHWAQPSSVCQAVEPKRVSRVGNKYSNKWTNKQILKKSRPNQESWDFQGKLGYFTVLSRRDSGSPHPGAFT